MTIHGLEIKNVCYLPSGRIFIANCNGYPVECTEMRDVVVGGKEHAEVRVSQDPRVIWKHLVPYEEKWLLTVSTQKGCPHKCQFCDVPGLPFCGNLTAEEILKQVWLLIENTKYVKRCKKVKIGFSRMGEPAHNLENVLTAMKMLGYVSECCDRDFTWLPCFNTILPYGAKDPTDVLMEVLEFKKRVYGGFLHLQISCNSTDEDKRKELFGGAKVLDLELIVRCVKKNDHRHGRTTTLNFIVMDGVEIDVGKLVKMGLNGNQFCVKLIPLNKTERAEAHGLTTSVNYDGYDQLLAMKDEFEKAGIPVVVDAIARCEEAGLCCGQLAQIQVSQ